MRKSNNISFLLKRNACRIALGKLSCAAAPKAVTNSMKSTLFLSIPLFACIALTSCYQLPDRPRRERPKEEPAAASESVTSQDQQKIQAQRDKMKAAEKKRKAASQSSNTVKKKTPTESTTTTEKPAPKKKTDYAFANPVPGKPGFVFSPFNNSPIDVRDIPSGTLVQDPTFPASEKKYFRVP